MTRSTPGFVTLLLAGLLGGVAAGQDPPGSLPPPATAAPAPGSLLPPPAQAAPPPGPYFEVDPLLDPAQLPPGPFGEVEAAYVSPHVFRQISGTVQVPGLAAETVNPPVGHLPWTVSPRFLVGYRIPSGFGEVSLAYRNLASSGTETAPGPDGPSAVRSRLDQNVFDLDYASREISLWRPMDMRWHVGARLATTYFDTQQTTAAGLAAAGTGVAGRRLTNQYYGFGPEFGLEFVQHASKTLAVVARIDGASVLGRIRQGFSETGAAPGPGGAPAAGTFSASSSQNVPILNTQIGLRWQPMQHTDVFLGYQYEHWWNVGRLNNLNTMGEVYNQGLVLRASFRF